MKQKVICGIQQVGIGVKSVKEAWPWYIDNFGFDVKIFDDEGTASLMLPYTGGKPQPRYAILALNLRGGGGFEIWEPRGRELNYPARIPRVGDYGIFTAKIKSPDVLAAYKAFTSKGLNVLSPINETPDGRKHFFMMDPWNNLFEIEEDSYVFINQKSLTGGANGAILGVADMDRSINFYSKLLGYDTVVYDKTGQFKDLEQLPGGSINCRRVLLKPSKAPQGPLSEIMGTSHIELIQNLETDTDKAAKIYEGRLWGDPGFIHLCFDIRNMDTLHEEVKDLGLDFVCDSGLDFDMGDANGHFTYVEDPSGTLIEFVETFKVPIAKKLGLVLSLADKDDLKPLPRYLTKALRFLRTRK